jgi:hypothetical protein
MHPSKAIDIGAPGHWMREISGVHRAYSPTRFHRFEFEQTASQDDAVSNAPRDMTFSDAQLVKWRAQIRKTAFLEFAESLAREVFDTINASDRIAILDEAKDYPALIAAARELGHRNGRNARTLDVVRRLMEAE